MAVFGLSFSAYGTTLYYNHPSLHLTFALDTDSKEAMVGSGLEVDKACAIFYPPIDDPWWNDSPKENYWRDLVIPSTITCSSAFDEYGNNVQLGNETFTVTKIAPLAFYKSTYVQTVELPETIREIGGYAFYWCINLRTINIPSQITEISTGTFVWCNKLKKVVLPESISFIGISAFSDCIGLEEINIPSNCESIGDEAFKWCTSLSTLTIEDGTTPLKLACCYGLGLNYEGSMPKHYRGMFSDCPLKKLYLGRDIEFFSIYVNGWYPPFMEYDYKGKGSNNKDVWIENGKIYNEVTIGDNVTVIPESMFQYASIPNAITFPSHLISIGDDAFSNRSGTGGTLHQSQLNFPSTLESIGKSAFNNCSGLGTIVCERTTPPTLQDKYVFWNCNPLFIVPTGTRTTYLNSENWDKQKIVEASDEVITINVKTAGTLLDRLLAQDRQLGTVTRLKLKGTLNDDDWANVKKMTVLYDLDISELDLEEISASQFEKSSLIYIKFPNTIKRICNNAFYQSRSLTGIIEIPESCTEIGAQAFRETGITGLLYEGPLHISEYAFSNCPNLEDLYIKGEGTIVDWLAFGNCGLKKVTIGRGVTLGENAVVLCDNLKEVVIEDGVKSLGLNSLYNNGLEKVYFEGAVEELGKWVFRNEYLREIHISDIGKWCQLPFPDNGINSHPLYKSSSSDPSPTLYYNGEVLENIIVTGDVDRIGGYSFAYCEDLKSVNMMSSIKYIDNSAFIGCTQLEEVHLPNSMQVIESNAFRNCRSLKKIDLPQNMIGLGSYAFENCVELQQIDAHWTNPIFVVSNIFANISSDCFLYIPIGTASKYSNAGWSCIPNMKARGLLQVKTNEGGVVSCLDNSVSNEFKTITFNPYSTFDITFSPNVGYRLMKVVLNGIDNLSNIVNNRIEIEEAEEDYSLDVIFAKEGVNMGDANGDFEINNVDVTTIAEYILKKKPQFFYDYATDINDDGVINVTDIIILIENLKNKQ